LPEAWDLFTHPNGDFYFYNSTWRLITPEDVRDPVTLEHIIDAREEYIQELQDDVEVYSRLPNDYEVVITDLSSSAAAIRMYSRSAGAAYTWTEETGRLAVLSYLPLLIVARFNKKTKGRILDVRLRVPFPSS
jgi:hypothetical protein